MGVPIKLYICQAATIDHGSMGMSRYQDIATLALRLATAANFLSPVASRFGLWGRQSAGWKNFLTYAAEVNSFAPAGAVPLLAIASTVLETAIPVLLILGYKTRLAALGAASLTFIFAVAMSYSFGVKSPLDYGVFVDCTSAFLLATMPSYRWSLDNKLSATRTLN
jgi:putative oxidoreductase